jgi:2-dehydro-3-deoxyphosphogluconate aldolase/(4S)-4-hydroxy-2-oxoglutarate aldolase
MTRQEVLEHIQRTRVIAIVRGEMHGKELEIAEALVEGGIAALEISIVTPGSDAAIRKLASRLGDRIAIGAGTVLTVEELRRVADCGASFVVSPNIDPPVIELTRNLELASFPGAYTPTEIVLADRYGADAVKVFPAVSLGAPYIRALQGPLPGIRLIPTGGIHLQNLAEYQAAGAWAVGIGSELVGYQELNHFNPQQLTEKARNFVHAGGAQIHV